jgi:hypothetical protein
MLSGVPLAIVFVPVKATVALAPLEPLLKLLKVQVCPIVPVTDPPEAYWAVWTEPLPVANVKVPLATMSGVTPGILQAAPLVWVTEAGAHSRTDWPLPFT